MSILALKALAVLVVAVAAISIAPEHPADAQAGDLTGVYCMDLYTDGGDPVTPKGDPHQSDDGIPSGPNAGKPETKIMTRIDDAGGGAWNLTSVAYRGPGGFSVTAPPTNLPCASKTDGNSLTVPPQAIDLLDRPTATGVVNIKGGDKSLEWDICNFEEDLGLWVNTHWNVVVETGPPYYGELLVEVGTNPSICGTVVDPVLQRVIIEMYKRVATKGTPGAGADDWDGDGFSDWVELSQYPPDRWCDPFNPNPCDVVGGVAEAPGLTSAPTQAGESSGGGLSVMWAIGIALSAGAGGIVTGVWYLRRRRADG